MFNVTLPDESPVTAAGCSGHVRLFCCQLSQCSRLVTPGTIQTSILCMLLVLLQKPQPFQGSGILGSIWVEQPGGTQRLGSYLCVPMPWGGQSWCPPGFLWLMQLEALARPGVTAGSHELCPGWQGLLTGCLSLWGAARFPADITHSWAVLLLAVPLRFFGITTGTGTYSKRD